MLARLDLLPHDERRVLQVGSIFGRSFRPDGIAAIEPSLARVEDLCDSITAKDLVRPTEGDRCAFRHILIREVAYQTLPRSERKRLHAAAAAWLESRVAGREVALGEIVAFHYREAALLGSAIDPDGVQAVELRRQAVRWLVMAADVAQSAAAYPETVRHLRAAIELAEESATGVLHERIGECSGGDTGVAEYRLALGLYKKYGAPPEDQLRALAGMLMFSTRMQGSVAERMTGEQMEAVRSEGRALAASTDDRRARARFLAADAFYPFWIQADGRPSDGVLELANAEAKEALDAAREMGDYNLASMALDALSGNATAVMDFPGTLAYAEQRLEFEDRLNLFERIDALSMNAWMYALLGDLKASVDASGRAMAVVQPGQVPANVMHPVAWRAYSLQHLGRWDETLPLGTRLLQLWEEVGRFAAGYALRGVVAVWMVARARRDPLGAELAAMIHEVGRHYEPDHPNHTLSEFIAGNPEAGTGYLVNRGRSRFAPETREQVLGILCDAGAPPPLEVVAQLEEEWKQRVPLLQAQCRRARGLLLSDPAALEEAESLFAARGEVPCLARVRVELGLLTDDKDRLLAGTRVLEGLGDGEYLGRHRRGA